LDRICREPSGGGAAVPRRSSWTLYFTMIELMPNFAFRHRWWHWVVAILAAELLWFCAMYPLVPRTAGAAALEALLPLPLIGYIYLAVLCLFWISGRNWSAWTRRLLGTAIALSAGAAGIWMVAWAVVHTSAEFGYMLIRRV
jgi:hypothetical protein